jgi:hypothetical protein
MVRDRFLAFDPHFLLKITQLKLAESNILLNIVYYLHDRWKNFAVIRTGFFSTP